MNPYNISLPASVIDSSDYYKKTPEGICQSTTPTPPPQTTSSINQSSSPKVAGPPITQPLSSPKVGGPSIVPPIPSGVIHQTQSPSLRVEYPPIHSNTSLQEKSSSPKVSGAPNRPAIPNSWNLVKIKPLVTYSSSVSGK
ncbi:hypothetical protein O181_065836 [Austropuccinia psidii MF-1]|uniref:Uncharacterized protein n=1 Tax=Austropuccinia psidii MF-1 TaxID=1389203 RepID=A0A9Q3I1K7_9BASI|nr:hypothetical protein [Austropuccinia psidii MF-1]